MDRKALVRAYKETRRPMGVYRVRSLVTGRAVVGTSVDLPGILNRHRAQLRFGGHRDPALQAEWREHGEAAFAFEVLDTLEPPKDDPSYDPTEDLKVLLALHTEGARQ
jgi:hypothetical protein